MRLHRYAMVLAALVTTLVVAGCDSGDGIDTQTPTRSSTTSPGPTSSTPTETVSPEEQAVLAAYAAFYVALDEAQADPQQSQVYLEPVATGAQLETTNGGIKAGILDGIESFGTPVLTPTVASIEVETAEVHDCQDTSEVGTRKIDTGEVLGVGQAEDSARTTLTKVDSVWKVAATDYIDPPGEYCE